MRNEEAMCEGLLSVVIPVYNIRDYVERCVRSVLAQPDVPLEVLIVDDGSTDDSGAVCDALAAEDSRVTVIHKPNGGLSDARNYGLCHAQGEYILFMDGDDWLAENVCPGLLQMALQDRADVVIGKAHFLREEPVMTRWEEAVEENFTFHTVYTGKEYLLKCLQTGGLRVEVGRHLYRTDFLRANGLQFCKGILHEDEAAALLYKAAAGRNIHGTEPKEGKIELVADCDGLLKIDRAALLAVNRTPQMMIAVIHGDLPVKKGQKLAGTRIIPLVIEQEKMDAMQAAAGAEPILNVLPMQAKKVGIITTGSEVFKGRIEDKFTPILQSKLAVYGCEMVFHKVCDDDPAGITAAILEAKAAGCELIFTTGGMSVDPDDRTPLAIKNTGADIITYGAPVLPGAMFLVSYLDGVPVCGLPGCVMYAKRTIFDLLLPRLLADDPITAEDIARLGEGGLCLNCEVCHWPNCGFGHC